MRRFLALERAALLALLPAGATDRFAVVGLAVEAALFAAVVLASPRGAPAVALACVVLPALAAATWTRIDGVTASLPLRGRDVVRTHVLCWGVLAALVDLRGTHGATLGAPPAAALALRGVAVISLVGFVTWAWRRGGRIPVLLATAVGSWWLLVDPGVRGGAALPYAPSPGVVAGFAAAFLTVGAVGPLLASPRPTNRAGGRLTLSHVVAAEAWGRAIRRHPYGFAAGIVAAGLIGCSPAMGLSLPYWVLTQLLAALAAAALRSVAGEVLALAAPLPVGRERVLQWMVVPAIAALAAVSAAWVVTTSAFPPGNPGRVFRAASLDGGPAAVAWLAAADVAVMFPFTAALAACALCVPGDRDATGGRLPGPGAQWWRAAMIAGLFATFFVTAVPVALANDTGDPRSVVSRALRASPLPFALLSFVATLWLVRRSVSFARGTEWVRGDSWNVAFPPPPAPVLRP